MKTTTIGSFLTPAEIRLCRTLWTFVPREEFATTVARDVITPALPRINATLGQENDARYLAYCIEAALTAQP